MSSARRFFKWLLVLSLFLPLAGCVSAAKDPKVKTSVWNQVKFGMTRAEIHKLLGPPMQPVDPPNQEVWRQGPGSSAWFFVVKYDQANKVLDYRSVYYYNPS